MQLNLVKDVRRRFIPYGHQQILQDDIDSVVEVLQSDWLTTGPKVGQFEDNVASYTGARHAIAVSSGTAALHAAMYAIGVCPGDEVIVPVMTFAATANCVVYQGGTPVFADVRPETLLIDPEDVGKKITPKTKAIIAVDYAGQPCDYDILRELCDKHGLILVADACHSIGGKYKGRNVGTLADLTVFSFHPVKHITTGEGGMVITEDLELASRMKMFRNHGINSDHKQRERKRTWVYEMTDLGFNYRMSDINAALGISQLRKLPSFLDRRREIATLYDKSFSSFSGVCPLSTSAETLHAYHLYVVQVDFQEFFVEREDFFHGMYQEGISVNVHYIPVHLHPFYRKTIGISPGLCPVAEDANSRIVSIPMFPAMCGDDVDIVINSMKKVLTK